MAFTVYILRCADGKYYTGHTDDLERRMGEHHTGQHCRFTATRLPVELIWADTFPTRYEALDNELRIKAWSRAKKEVLMRGNWAALKHYARPPSERPSP